MSSANQDPATASAIPTDRPPERILCVDDERNVLRGIQRNLGRDLHIEAALGPKAGLQAIEEAGPFAVIVSDMQMPEMDGATFLSRARRRLPHAVRILLTGQASVQAAQRAINRGGVHKYVTKPCPPDKLRKLLMGAIEEHRRVVREAQILEQTVQGSVEMLTEVLALLRPAALGRSVRLRHYVQHVCEQLGTPERWRYVTAAMLSQVGSVLLPEDLVARVQAGEGNEGLSDDELALLSQGRMTAYRLIAKVPRLEAVADIVAGDELDPGEHEDVAFGRSLLALATAMDAQVIRGATVSAAIGRLRKEAHFAPELIAALNGIPPVAELTLTRLVRAQELMAGMRVDQDVVTKKDVLLVSKGQPVDDALATRVKAVAKTVGVVEPIRVRVALDPMSGQAA